MNRTRLTERANAQAGGRSRRSMLKGIVGGGVVATTLASTGMFAQQGTSAVSPAATPAGEEPAWLYVITFRAAALAPAVDSSDQPTLTLFGVHDHALAFTDRPQRLSALLPVADLLEVIAAEAADPLNATLAAPLPRQETPALIVVVLQTAAWDGDAGVATLPVTITGGDFAGSPAAADGAVPETFEVGFLFIDSKNNGGLGPGLVVVGSA